MQLAITSQLNENDAMKFRQAQVTPTTLSGKFYYQLVGKITHFGFHALRKQLELLRHYRSEQNPPIFTGSWSRSMGMPRWHMIQEREAKNLGEICSLSYCFLRVFLLIFYASFHTL